MCEFCHKHGEGKRWYLKAENYSDDLLSDLKRLFIEGQVDSLVVSGVGEMAMGVRYFTHTQ